MPDAPVLDASVIAHLTLVAEERLRVTRWSLALRLAAVAAVSAVVVLHAPMNPSRYMFLAPLLALSAWITEASLAHRAQCLDALAEALRHGSSPRPSPLSMDLAPWSVGISWRRALLGGARVRWFAPLTLLAAAVTVDAQRFGPEDSPGEVGWYLGLAMVGLLVAALTAWSWWIERLAVAAAVVPPRPRTDAPEALAAPAASALFEPRPSSVPNPEPVRWAPKFDPNERPFPDPPRPAVEAPVAERSGTTQTFATVEIPGQGDPPGPL